MRSNIGFLKFTIDKGVHISTAQTKIVNISPKYPINHEWKKYLIEYKAYFTTIIKIHPINKIQPKHSGGQAEQNAVRIHI